MCAGVITDGYGVMRAKGRRRHNAGAEIDLVEKAGATKAPIARLADKVIAVFVPIFYRWRPYALIGSFGHAAQALTPRGSRIVISCPCALGLATRWRLWSAPGAAHRWAYCIKPRRRLKRLAALTPSYLTNGNHYHRRAVGMRLRRAGRGFHSIADRTGRSAGSPQRPSAGTGDPPRRACTGHHARARQAV
jgi:hypothetical protein